jgi:hypothetical protein
MAISVNKVDGMNSIDSSDVIILLSCYGIICASCMLLFHYLFIIPFEYDIHNPDIVTSDSIRERIVS